MAIRRPSEHPAAGSIPLGHGFPGASPGSARLKPGRARFFFVRRSGPGFHSPKIHIAVLPSAASGVYNPRTMPAALDPLLVRNLGIALLIGALVGVEREKKKLSEPEGSTGGLRTFILYAMTGAVSAHISQELQTPWIFAVTVLAVALTVVAGYVLHVTTHRGSIGLTSEMAAIGVCLLGGLTMVGPPEVPVALAVVTSAVLALKRPLHTLVEKLGNDDILAGLKLLIATFIVLPLLPDKKLGPFVAWNPYKLWLLVIMVSSLSLIGYVAVRWLGTEKGTAITALSGGLVSSTAVTLSLAKQSREGHDAAHPGSDQALASGVLLAWTVMFVRVAAMVAVIHPPLLLMTLPSIGGMGLAVLLFVGMGWWKRRKSGEASTGASEVPLKNPFSLSSAIKFALFFALILLIVRVGETYFAGQGLYAISLLAGLTDVDAITLSIAGLAKAGTAEHTAAICIIVAALSNTLVKWGFCLAFGSRQLAKDVSIVTAVLAVCGVVPLFFLG